MMELRIIYVDKRGPGYFMAILDVAVYARYFEFLLPISIIHFIIDEVN